MMALARNGGPQLVTFDGDLTLYDDGKSLAVGDAVISRIMALLSKGARVAIVTAAGYTDGQKYYERLLGLLEYMREAVNSGKLSDPQFAVMGGESQYLFVFDINEKSLLRMVPRSVWKLEIMKTWTEKDIKALLDAAQEALGECIENLALSAEIIRKERAVGIIPKCGLGTPKLTREQLEETVLITQQRIEMMQPKIPFSAFNGYRTSHSRNHC
jgi:IMP and pyridine-specific 5'-nucleotidase